jgi:predicted negative regulator of RcsB-dependent stress response
MADKETPKKPVPAPSPSPSGVTGAPEWQPLRDLWKAYGITILTAIAVGLLAVVAAAFYRNHKQTVADETAARLSSARTAQDLENIVARHPSASVAPPALLRLAMTYFDAGNHDLALARYQDFKAKFPAHSLAAVAEMGIIHCTEGKGLLDEAVRGFKDFAVRHPGHFLAAEATLGQGRCLEALGKLDEARTVYEDFIAAHPQSGWKPLVEEALDAVKKKLAGRKTASPTADKADPPADGVE